MTPFDAEDTAVAAAPPGVGAELRQARALREKGDAAGALRLLEAAHAAHGPKHLLLRLKAECLALSRPAEAVGAFEAAIAAAPAGADRTRADHLGLLKALAAAGAPPGALDAAARRGSDANPSDRTLLEARLAADGGGRPGGRANRLDALRRLQAGSPALLPAAAVELARELGPAAVASEFAEQTERFRSSPASQALAALWSAHAAGEPLDGAVAARAAAVHGPEAQLFFLLRRPAPRRYRLSGLRDEEKSELAAMGVDWRAQLAELEVALRPQTREAAAFLDGARFAGAAARDKVRTTEAHCGFQDRMVATGALSWPDPGAGGGPRCHALDGCVVYGRAAYMFKGARGVFYLLVGGAGGKLLGVYIPGREAFLDFDAAVGEATSDVSMANLLAVLARRLCRSAGLYNAAVAAPERYGRPRSPVVAVGRIQNFAHQVWNHYSGVERLVRSGLAGKIGRVLTAGTEFFGPFDRIFPELGGKVEAVPRTGTVDPCPFSDSELPVLSGGYFVSASLRDRLARTLAALPRRDGAASPETHGGPLPWPVVWIGMRLGDKSWVGQREGIARVVARIAARFPGALFLLDGFSYPAGRDEISAQWGAAREALARLAEEIRAACPDPGRVVSLVGNSMRESVLWAARTDAYLSPIGTTQHKIGWFTAAPGVVYASPRLADHVPETLPGAWEAEGIRAPRYVFGAAAAAAERRNVNDRRRNNDNLELDADALADELLGLLEGAEPDRTATATAPVAAAQRPAKGWFSMTWGSRRARR